MNVTTKDLQEFNKLWQKHTGIKLTKAEATVEFHKLVALVKLQAELVIQEDANKQSDSKKSIIAQEKDLCEKTRNSSPRNTNSKYNKRA